MSTEIYKPNGVDLVHSGQIARQNFGGSEIERNGETASSAVAAREQSATQARYIMAMRNPRDMELVRVRLLKECDRPGFADTARYHKPIGRGVEGPSIRFCEAALRCMTNVYPEVTTVYDDAERRILRVAVTDLEANVTYATEATIDKTVERRELKDGQIAIRTRQNSEGKPTHLVHATEDELLNKQNALISKAIRTNGLRLLPGDILEECMERVIKTQRDKAAKDPDAEKRRMIDAFAAMGITPLELQEYLGHPLERVQPAEIVELRGVHSAMKEGDTWASIMEAKNPGGSKAAAASVAADKLAGLRRGKQATPDTETKATGSNAESTDSASSEGEPQPELQQHQKAILEYRAKIGVGKFNQILGACGYESVEQIAADKFSDVARELEAEMPKPETQTEAPAAKKLQFGKPGGQK